MFAIFDTKTNKVIFSADSKAEVLEVFNKTMPDNKGELYDGYKIVKIEVCCRDTDDELYDEIVNLDSTFYAWVLPRLVCFRKHNQGYPLKFGSLEQWNAELDKMIKALEGLLNCTIPYKDVDTARDFVEAWFGENLGKLWL